MTDEAVIPVRVALRTRPMVKKEIDEGASNCLEFIKEANQVIISNNKSFTFDYTFPPTTTQDEVYISAVKPLIARIFKGYNGTVLAYGQTGSGKTFTMGSAHTVSKDGITDKSCGVIPRVIKDIFDGIEERSNKFEFVVKVWYAEIYKEEVKDLLAYKSPQSTNSQNLHIREYIDGSIKIEGITEVDVSSPESTLGLMEAGNNSRATGSTAMNKTSSRSHAIFTIVLESRSREHPDDYTVSKFNLVDLAGSERIKRTRAEGDRLKEGIKINAGLLALGNVISALGEGKQGQYIPYRDSKLTRLLQNSLGGNSMTVMIACASPAATNSEETLNTLRYADRARKIKNKAVVNRDPNQVELARLRQEVQSLRLQLATGRPDVSSPPIIQEQLTDNHKKLTEQVDVLVKSNCELCEKVISSESALGELKNKFYDLQKSARDVCDDTHDLSLIENELSGKDQEQDCIKKLRKLHDDVLKVKVDSEDITKDIDTIDITDVSNSSNVNDSFPEAANDSTNMNVSEVEKQQHVLHTACLTQKLREISESIQLKEETVRKMTDQTAIVSLKKKYEEQVTRLDSQIDKLEFEKNKLQAALEDATKMKESKATKEQRQKQILKLEEEIKKLKIEKRENEKLVKMKAQSDSKIVKLNGDISNLKNTRIKLMKEMKDTNKKYMQWRKNKENEVKQLQKLDRKRQAVISRMEIKCKKQSNVLKRKDEEVAAVTRRLNDLLLKQKQVKNKRNLAQSKKAESSSHKWKNLVTNELDVRVMAQSAKKILKGIEEEKASLKEELRILEESEMKTKKRRRTLCITDQQTEAVHRRQLTDSIEIKEAQIKELNDMIDGAKESMSSYEGRLSTISSIQELRSVMKYLMNVCVDERIENETCRRNEKAQQERGDELVKEVQQMQAAMEKVEYESSEKVRLLTNQLYKASCDHDASTSSQNKSQNEKKLQVKGENAKKMKFEPDVSLNNSLQLVEHDSGDEYVPTPILNRKKKERCSCTASKCSDKRCSCYKAGRICDENCACDVERCSIRRLSSNSESEIKESPQIMNTTFVAEPSSKEPDTTGSETRRLFQDLDDEHAPKSTCSPTLKIKTKKYEPIFFESPIPLKNRKMNKYSD